MDVMYFNWNNFIYDFSITGNLHSVFDYLYLVINVFCSIFATLLSFFMFVVSTFLQIKYFFFKSSQYHIFQTPLLFFLLSLNLFPWISNEITFLKICSLSFLICLCKWLPTFSTSCPTKCKIWHMADYYYEFRKKATVKILKKDLQFFNSCFFMFKT